MQVPENLINSIWIRVRFYLFSQTRSEEQIAGSLLQDHPFCTYSGFPS